MRERSVRGGRGKNVHPKLSGVSTQNSVYSFFIFFFGLVISDELHMIQAAYLSEMQGKDFKIC